MERVVITGAAGLIGSVLLRDLGDRYSIRGIDRSRRGGAGISRANLRKSRSLVSLFEGASAVVDLAALTDAGIGWRDVCRNNLPATMNSLAAARSAGVHRFVFASSSRVTGMYEQEHPYSAIIAGEYAGLEPTSVPLITSSTPLRPDSPYALGKVFGEAAGRYYSDAFGLSVICLRIGSVTVENAPLAPRHFATLLTHGDLVRLVQAALSAPDELRFGVYYGVSRNTWRFWDLDRAYEEIGYVPIDDAEMFRSR